MFYLLNFKLVDIDCVKINFGLYAIILCWQTLPTVYDKRNFQINVYVLYRIG